MSQSVVVTPRGVWEKIRGLRLNSSKSGSSWLGCVNCLKGTSLIKFPQFQGLFVVNLVSEKVQTNGVFLIHFEWFYKTTKTVLFYPDYPCTLGHVIVVSSYELDYVDWQIFDFLIDSKLFFFFKLSKLIYHQKKVFSRVKKRV